MTVDVGTALAAGGPATNGVLCGAPATEIDVAARPVGGPVRVAWREGTLARVKELEALLGWARRTPSNAEEAEAMAALTRAMLAHLDAARQAATEQHPRRTNGTRIERAMSNLDAAEADLLQMARPAYILGQLPSVLNHIRRHLRAGDPRRTEVEWLAKRLAPSDVEDETPEAHRVRDEHRRAEIDQHRHALVSAHRGASSAALREQTRVRSFRNVVVLTTLGMTIVAVALVLIGAMHPSALPLCFAPQQETSFTVVCPMEQSPDQAITAPGPDGRDAADIDVLIEATVGRFDIAVIAVVGLTAASIAAAAAIRSIRGTSEPYGVPLALALLKLPTGAVTAVVGLLLMRGQFIPGLSALDSSAQILAWAAIFGYGQQVFTRLVDQQGHAVLDGVRGGTGSGDAARSV
jgi:hypothetical protein